MYFTFKKVGLAITVLAIVTTLAIAEDVTASKSANLTKTGPRPGTNGTRYFNIQGKNSGEDGKYACFGVLDFEIPKPKADAKPSKVKSAKLVLTQSVAKFAKEGPISIRITSDLKTDPATLKFDATSADSLGEQLKPTTSIGEGNFKPDTTGHADSFTLQLDDKALAAIAKVKETGGVIRIVVTPANADVAATYFGAGNDTEANRPKLVIEIE